MLSHLKRRIGVLTAVAVLAALVPALSTSPASAAPATTPTSAGDGASYSACPASAAIPSAGFTDTTSTDVDCIKYYGITQGATATTYDPTASVPRWQMALFLTRAATKMGVTLGDGSDQGFTDISGEAADIQTAINQLKQLGVTTGTTATTYSPADDVTREQMAMFIERLGDSVTAGSGGSSDEDAGVTTQLTVNGTTATYNYTDIDSGVTFEGHNAIVEMYNLGITGHTKATTTFGPTAAIPRSEMATWLVNLAGHSDLRPAGLHIQANYNTSYGDMSGAGYSLLVSDRSDAFAATADTLVDVFGFTTTTTADESGLTAAGGCKDALNVSTGSEDLCVMGTGDFVTDQNGNIVITQAAIADGVDVDEGESVQYWAWTAAVGTYFSAAQTASTTSVTSISDGPTLHVSVSHPLAKLTASTDVMDVVSASDSAWDAARGVDRTFTLQLRSVGAGASNTATYNVAQECGIAVAVYEATTLGGAVTSITNSTIFTDATGQATFTPTTPADTTATDGTHGMTVAFSNYIYNSTAGTDYALCADIATVTYDTDFDGDGEADTDGFSFVWNDAAATANTIVGAVASKYVTASDTGTGATNTITGTSYDNYGMPRANVSLFLQTMTGHNIDGIGDDVASTFTMTRTTNSAGTATFGLTRDDGDPAEEKFTIVDDGVNNTSTTQVAIWTDAPSATALDSDLAASAPTALAPTEAWDGTVMADDDGMQAQIVAVDLAADTYVVEISYYDETAGAGDTTFIAYTWDSNDYFHDGGVAMTQATYEYWLGVDGVTNATVDSGTSLYHASNNGTQTVQSSSNPSEYNRP